MAPANRKGESMRKRWLKLAALPIAFTFVAAACSTSDDDDSGGGTVAGGATTAGGTTATTTGGTTGTTTAGTTGTTTGGTTGTTAGGGGECITTPATTAAPGSSAPATTAAPGTTAPPPSVPPPGGAGTVTVFGVEDSENEAGAMQDALTEFGEANGIDITYVGRRDFEQQINAQVLGGNPPDIAAFPQPGKLKQFAQDGELFQVPDDVVASVKEGWADSYMAFSNVDGTQYGVPLKSDFKSSVWYLPCVWEEKGYEVPETLADFKALVDEMIANGDTPLCVGIESGPATGWPFTDWVEELILREQGIDFYNQWVAHEVPFNDPKVVDTFNEVAGPDGLWTKDGAVYASGGSIAATAFGDNGTPLVQGKCMMHRQASFYSAFFPEGTEFGEGPGQVSTFYFPADEGHPVLVGGISAGAFRDAPEVWKVMEYLGSADFANARQAAQVERVGGEGSLSGFLTGNSQADTSLWAPLEQDFIESLTTADPAAFDASDQMPAEVGSGTFWSEGTSFVNGDEDAETATGNIESSWPS
jgi:alpha-glucoside transport system substrate-binding protein